MLQKYESVFNKIDIYNKRKDLFESTGRYNEILFTKDEQAAVNDLIVEIQQHIFENAYQEMLNENFFTDAVKKGVDKVSQVASNVKDKAIELTGKAKAAYQFCQEILKKGVTKVSELIQFFVDLLAKLADTVKEAIMKLGGFGENDEDIKGDNEEDVDLSEKTFLGCVEEYVSQRWGKKELKENWLDKVEDKVAHNKFLEVIICGKYKGKKLSFWKSLLVSIVGSIVINLGVGIICSACGIAAPVAGTITSIVLIIWSLRGVAKIILNRKHEMKQNGDTKFWNKSVVISLLITVGITALFQIPAVKEFFAGLINTGVEKVSTWVAQFSTPGSATPEAVQNALQTSSEAAANNDGLAAQWSEAMKGVSSGPAWLETMKQRAAEHTQLLAKAAHNFATNIHYPNGSGQYIKDNLAEITKRCQEEGVHINPEEYIKKLGDFGDKISFTSSNAGGTTWGSIIPSDDPDMGKFFDIVDNLAAEQGVSFDVVDLGSGIVPPTPPVDAVVPVDPAIINIAPYFGGFAFVPQFGDKCAGKFKIAMGSEAAARQFVPVTDVKEMTMEEVEKAMTDCGANANDEGFKMVKNQDTANKNYTNELYNVVSKDLTEAAESDEEKADDKLKDALKLNADPKKDKCMVFFTSFKNKDGEVKKMPLVAFNYRTMYACDLINAKNLHTRKNPYFFKGLFNHLTIKPIDEKDTLTKSEIKSLLTKVLYGSVLGNAKLCQASIGKVSIIDRLKGKAKWEAKGKDNDKERLEFGNFTNNEIVKMLNEPSSCYNYFAGDLATDISGTDEHGNVKNAHEDHTIIEDKKDYIKTRVLPVMKCKDTDLYKDLKNDELVSKYFINEDGDLKDDMILAIADSLMRSPETFNKETDVTLADHFLALFGNKNKENKRKAEAIQRLSEIIWKYKESLRAWEKQVKIANKANDKSEEIKPTEKDTKQLPVSKEDKKKAEEEKKQAEKAKESKPEEKSDDKSEENAEDKKSDDQKKEETTDAKPVSSFQKKQDWFNQTIMKRIATPERKLYKELIANETIKAYFGDKTDKQIIAQIGKDKILIATLYSRFKKGKNATENYWNVKLPKSIMKIQKSQKKKVDAEAAKKKSMMIKEFYNIISKYRRNSAKPEDKKQWKKFMSENKKEIIAEAFKYALNVLNLKRL